MGPSAPDRGLAERGNRLTHIIPGGDAGRARERL